MALIRHCIVLVALVSMAAALGGCGNGGEAVAPPETITYICAACNKQFEAKYDPTAGGGIMPQAKCPGCGKMAAMATKCLNCGKYYLTSQAMDSANYNPEEGKPPTLKCPHCGKDPTKAPPKAAK